MVILSRTFTMSFLSGTKNSDTSMGPRSSTNVTFTTEKAINQSLLCRNM